MNKIALCGNPNVGKSTIFNALTGMKQHTGNWAGKTVETARGIVHYGDETWELIDLPGTYSLYGGSPEEIAASNYLTFTHHDLIIVVCDALCLERNLNLAIQMGSFTSKLLLCVNMIDEATHNHIDIDTEAIERMTGIPVIGTSAKNKKSINHLKETIHCQLKQKKSNSPAFSLQLPEQHVSVYEQIIEILQAFFPETYQLTLAAFRIMAEGAPFIERLSMHLPPEKSTAFCASIASIVKTELFDGDQFAKEIIQRSYKHAEEICLISFRKPMINTREKRQFILDKLLSTKILGIPMMICMLMLVLYITISGANIPSSFLSKCFSMAEPVLDKTLSKLRFPFWLSSLLIDGVYRVTSWIVAVMLPPMAIFFPLFTLLEELGLLPRIAFHLDRCFYRCGTCGKQALCMCMGLGCNAVGVTGTRIIQSPRERLIAILTNSLIPCNGRFPVLIALISLFFSSKSTFKGALFLTCALILSTLIALVYSKLLSKSVLRGISSACIIELPPFRKPKIGEIVVRSIFDRTLLVLGRAICAAFPAGLLIWALGNIHIGNETLLGLLAAWLNPAGVLLGLDGATLLAFLIGLPANELIIPALMMIYMQQGTLLPLDGLETLYSVLVLNGWNVWKAACAIIFTMFHWPCVTTLLTVYKETKSIRWTAMAFAVPLSAGAFICIFLKGLSMFFV